KRRRLAATWIVRCALFTEKEQAAQRSNAPKANAGSVLARRAQKNQCLPWYTRRFAAYYKRINIRFLAANYETVNASSGLLPLQRAARKSTKARVRGDLSRAGGTTRCTALAGNS